MNGKLTHTQVKAVEPGDRVRKLFDGGGLYLEVRPAGGKYWRYAYRFQGRMQTLTIGQFPDISLSMAREKHAEARRILAGGDDPGDENRTAKLNRCNRLLDVAIAWQESHARSVSAVRASHIAATLRLHILPQLGHMPVADIGGGTIIAWMRRLESADIGQHAVIEARNILAMVLNDAAARGVIQMSPLWNSAVRKSVRPPPHIHHPAPLEPDKAGEALSMLWARQGSDCALARASRLLAYTAVRPAEACAMRWEDIDFTTGEWRYDVTKTITKHIVPLSRQVLELLCDRKASGFVFASRGSFGHLNPISLTQAFKRSNLGGILSPHGCRAMFRTMASEHLGYSAEVLEIQLAHKVPGPLGDTYQRARFLDQRHRLMQEWADYIDGLRARAQEARAKV